MHHTYCTVQLFSPQPESSHAEERWRGEKKGQNRREGGCEGKTRKREREKKRMEDEKKSIKEGSLLQVLALY